MCGGTDFQPSVFGGAGAPLAVSQLFGERFHGFFSAGNAESFAHQGLRRRQNAFGRVDEFAGGKSLLRGASVLFSRLLAFYLGIGGLLPFENWGRTFSFLFFHEGPLPAPCLWML